VSARRLTKCRVDSGGDSVDSDAAVYSVVELLDDHQLETLVTAVETAGSDGHSSECIILDNSAAHFDPHVICCRLWRWPSLHHSGDIRCMPWCQSRHGNGGVLESSQAVCCHPFHWSRQLFPGNTLAAFLPFVFIALVVFSCILLFLKNNAIFWLTAVGLSQIHTI